MSAIDPRTPCVVGVARATWRPDGSSLPLVGGEAPEPLDMWESVVRGAVADTGAPGAVLSAVDSLQVVHCQSWPYDDPPGRLAERLGIDPPQQAMSGAGGTVPLRLLEAAASEMAEGSLDVAVVCSGEALATKRRLKKAGERPSWSHRHPDPPPFPFEAPFHDAEVAHEVFQAWLTFAVRDVARRHHLGTAPRAHRLRAGEMLAPMTSVAAADPHAWFPTERTAGELVEVTDDNRMVGYPYTKLMVAMMDVDMAAAVVLCSHEKAEALGIPAERRVYLRGSAHASDPVYVAEHDPLWGSPAMAASGRAALAAAGVGIDDVAHLDLYSCFASSVSFAVDALGIAVDDPRPLTVTGGLPFHGGPGSGYLTHAVAAMVERLRDDPGATGMVSGVGMHMTHHAHAVWSTDPPEGRFSPTDHTGLQAAVSGLPRRALVHEHEGPGVVAAYSVVHGRSGDAEWGLVVCDLDGGRRCYARVDDADTMQAMEEHEWVGTFVRLETVDGPMGRMNVVRP